MDVILQFAPRTLFRRRFSVWFVPCHFLCCLIKIWKSSFCTILVDILLKSFDRSPSSELNLVYVHTMVYNSREKGKLAIGIVDHPDQSLVCRFSRLLPTTAKWIRTACPPGERHALLQNHFHRIICRVYRQMNRGNPGLRSHTNSAASNYCTYTDFWSSDRSGVRLHL